MTGEEQKFIAAFYRVHGRGEVPTPALLIEEMTGTYPDSSRRPGGPNINGRLSGLRIDLLEKEGYVKVDGRWRRNTSTPGETPSTGDWR